MRSGLLFFEDELSYDNLKIMKERQTRVPIYDYFGDVRTVDVTIRRLREKLEENPAEPKYIMTKWGVGYYFRK